LSSTKNRTTAQARKKADPSVAHVRGDTKVPVLRPGRPGGARDENRKAKTDALKRAALGAFLERGIEAVTIDEIAHAAGIAKGSFYRYFDDKTALVAALIQPAKEQIEEALVRCEKRLVEAEDRASAYSAYQELALGLLPVAMFHFDVVRLYLQEARAPREGARAPIAGLVDVVDKGAVRLSEVAVQHGIIVVKDPRISAFATVGAIEQLAISVLRGRLDATPMEIVSTLIKMVYDGVGARPEAKS
jgi:AcrR family transcriptional regulator